MPSRATSIILVLSLGLALAVAVLASSPSLQRKEQFFFRLDLASSASGLAQVFFDIGRGFNEQDSVLDGVRGDKKMEHHRFALPPTTLYALRFDPINTQADFTISAATIVDSKGEVVHHFTAADFTAGKHIKSIERHGEVAEVTCVEGGVDPFLYVALPTNVSKALKFTEWLRLASLPGFTTFLVIAGLCLASLSLPDGALQLLSRRLHLRPWLTIGTLAVLAVLIQFHPVFFAVQTTAPLTPLQASAPSYTTSLAEYFRHGQTVAPIISLSTTSSTLDWANLFTLVPRLTNNAAWEVAVSILTSLCLYVFGCGLLAWIISRSLSVTTLVTLCVVFTSVWAPALFPLIPPAIAWAPWIALTWLMLARAETPSRLFLASTLILLVSVETVACERSLRVAMLLIATTTGGLLFLYLNTRTKSYRVLSLFAGSITLVLVGVAVGPTLWTAIPSKLSGSEASALHLIPASIGLTFFEGFFLGQNPRTSAPPSTNLVILAGVAWAFARTSELLSKSAFLAVGIVTLPIIILAAGVAPDVLFSGWIKLGTAAELQHAAWHTLVFISPLLAAFGFSDFHKLYSSPDRAGLIAKATVLFFAPFAVYFGTVQHHTSYTFKTAYFFSIIVGWTVAHLALTKVPTPSHHRASIILLICAITLAWWHHSPYALFFLQDALAAR